MNGHPGAWISGDLIRRKIARRPRGRDPDPGVSAREILKGTASRETHGRRDVNWTLWKKDQVEVAHPRNATRLAGSLRGALDSGNGEEARGGLSSTF